MKNKMKNIIIYAICFVLLVVSITGCTTPENNNEPENSNEIEKSSIDQINIVTGVTTGSWYPIGAAMSQIFAQYGIKANAEPGGGVSNVIMVSDGDAQIGMTTSNVFSVANAGKAPFEKEYDNFSAVCFLFNNYVHVIVSEDSGVTSVPELAGKPFSNQAVGTTTQMTFIDLLTAFDMEESDLTIQVGGQAEGSDQIKDNIVVGLTTTTPAPSGALTDLTMSKPCKLLEFDTDVLTRLQEINPGYTEYNLPAGMYTGQDEEVKGIGTPLVLIVNKEMPEDVVYDITKYLVENIQTLRESHNTMADLTVEEMADVGNLDMHPGAKKFFDEYFNK